MNQKLLLLLALFAFVNIFSSCKDDDDCDSCEAGFECVDGECVQVDPCAGITCDPGEICENGNCVELVCEEEEVSGSITADVTWKKDVVYILKGKVSVESGATLTIEPGTIIKGAEGVETEASALVIARGSKIHAEGTKDEPIIFTTVLDNIKCGTKSGTNLAEYDFGKWGGLIVLGNATISAKDGDGESQIEGLPGNEEYGKYGGNDDADNSGVIKYVSIRHGGALIGDGNEINGLTLGGVGTGTVIENVEVLGNLDDGIEFFGGSVNVKNAIVGFQGDDAIDIDQNYSGTVSNFYVIQGGDDTDEALEIDGPEGTLSEGLFTLENGTCIAVDITKSSPADLKSKAQGTINNVAFNGYDSKALKVRVSVVAEDCSDKTDTWTYVENGRLVISNSTYVGNVTAAGAMKTYVNAKDTEPDYQQKVDCFENNSAKYENVVDEVFNGNGNAISSTNVAGADNTAFEGWSWLSINNKIQ